MKIGVFLTLEAYSREMGTTEKFRCKVVDINKNHVFIDYPVHIKTKKTTSFRLGTHVIAEYLGSDQSVYRFKTVIKDKRKGKIPTLVFVLPKEDEIERIQRRQYVRIETAVDVAVHSLNHRFSPFTTVTADLSGGGLSIVVPKRVSLEENDKITLTLVLPMHSGSYHYLDLSGEIVRIIQNESSANTASIKLVKLSEQDKQVIIRFCFEKQREARQKEMQ
jgi:c-di-GMP-binding flagellar brake protein YcgR